MLTESVSDPRRANWLTITSMSEDLSWPEETNITRPSWELEAEILRLTTRLMMRECELRQVKNQLKIQTSKAQQQASSWRSRIEDKEEQIRTLLVQKDEEMQGIMSQLLQFEADLRKEQSRIENLLTEKDAKLMSQQIEIEHLKRCLDANKNIADNKNDSTVCQQTNSDSERVNRNYLSHELLGEDLPMTDTYDAVRKLKEGLNKIRAIQDVTNMKSIDLSYSRDVVFLEKKKVPTKTPQKMKDLKAKRINHHKTHRAVVNEFTGQAIL